MKREFLLNISFLILVNLIIKPVYIFAIEVNVQNTVGPEAYGLFFALFNFCYLFQIVNDLGIQNYNSRNIAKNPDQLSDLLPKILGTKTLLSLIFIALVFLGAIILDYSPSVYPLLGLVALNQILLSFLLYFRSNIAASGKYRADSLISVIDKFLLILILGYLLWFSPNKDQFKIEWFVLAQTGTLVLTILFALFVNYKIARSVHLYFSLVFSKNLLKKSLPYALIIFLMIAYTKMDGVMLERLLDDNAYAAGIYAAGFRLIEAFNMVGFLFAGLLLPMFSSLLKKPEELRSLVKTSFSFLFVLSIVLSFSGLLFSEEIMNFLYPNFEEVNKGKLLSILMISYIPMSMGYIFGTLLTAEGRLKKLNFLFLLGVLVNFILNLYLIPKHQFLGAARATIFTQYLVLVGQLILVYPVLASGPSLRFISKLGLFLISSYLLFWGMHSWQGPGWFVKMILGIILAIFISLVLKLIDLKSFRTVLSAK